MRLKWQIKWRNPGGATSLGVAYETLKSLIDDRACPLAPCSEWDGEYPNLKDYHRASFRRDGAGNIYERDVDGKQVRETFLPLRFPMTIGAGGAWKDDSHYEQRFLVRHTVEYSWAPRTETDTDDLVKASIKLACLSCDFVTGPKDWEDVYYDPQTAMEVRRVEHHGPYYIEETLLGITYP